jgi:heme/copper-type cytochrome/quinol oxidase subunit 2
MNPIRAGLIAAIPLALIGIVFMLWRGQSLVEMIKAGSQETSGMSDRQWYWLMLISLALVPFIFGVLAGLVYRWIGNQAIYLALVGGLAILFTILAWVSHTPGPYIKTVMNFLVALDFGLLIPFMTAY